MDLLQESTGKAIFGNDERTAVDIITALENFPRIR